MKVIQNQTFDAERALYGSHDILVKDCSLTAPLMARVLLRSAAMCRWNTASSICVIPSGMTMALSSVILR